MKVLHQLVTIFSYLYIQSQLNPSNGLSISPPSEEIFSNQLCPDPTTKSNSKFQPQPQPPPVQSPGQGQTPGQDGSSSQENPFLPPITSGSQMPPKIMAINLDKPKDSTHFYESCTFKEQQQPGSTRNTGRGSVRVRSINLNINSWNFSMADNCSTFIKFNNWDDHDGGRYPVLCGRENFDQYLGPYGHPMVLYYQWKNGGLSFPLFHSSYGEHHRDRKDTLELNYMQIYFFILSGGPKDNSRKCQVQQYRLDWLRLGCASVVNEEEPVCGEYYCNELESLYRSKMTIFKDGESENDTVLVWKSKSDKYRMRTFLRQKFVPVVFLIVLIFAYRSYMKAGLRYQNSVQEDIPDFRVRSFRLRRHIPTARSYPGHGLGGIGTGRQGQVTDPYWDYDEDDPPPYVYGPEQDNNIPNPDLNSTSSPNLTPGHNSRVLPKIINETDPPPPYESVCPPTYKEATKP